MSANDPKRTFSWLGPVRTSVKKQDQIHFAISRKVLVILWTRLKDFVDRVAGDERPLRNLRDEELRLRLCSSVRRSLMERPMRSRGGRPS